jgi:hypothetical protein
LYLGILGVCVFAIAIVQVGSALGSSVAERVAQPLQYLMLGYLAALIGCVAYLSGRSGKRLWTVMK